MLIFTANNNFKLLPSVTLDILRYYLLYLVTAGALSLIKTIRVGIASGADLKRRHLINVMVLITCDIVLRHNVLSMAKTN